MKSNTTKPQNLFSLKVKVLAGLKTELAFARLLGLDGDPHQALLALENHTDDQLRTLFREKSLTSQLKRHAKLNKKQ